MNCCILFFLVLCAMVVRSDAGEFFGLFGGATNETAGNATAEAKGKNPSGVNMTELVNIQQQMNERVNKLSTDAGTLGTALDDMENFSTSNIFQGVDLDSEIVDPREIKKKLDAFNKAQKDKAPEVAAKQTKQAREAYAGEVTPPIVILEGVIDNPLQHLQLMKLLTCKHLAKQIKEAKKALKVATTGAKIGPHKGGAF